MVEYRSIGSLITRKTIRAKNITSPAFVYAITSNQGFIRSDDMHDFQIYSEDHSNYLAVEKNDFAYNPSRLNIGSIAFYKNDGYGLVSPMYVVFHPDETIILPEYLFNLIKSELVRNRIDALKEVGARFRFHFSRWKNIQIPVPSIEEQERIVRILDTFTAGIENVKKQLFLRRKQYEYYRDHLLNPASLPNAEYCSIGEVCKATSPPRKLGTKLYQQKGKYPIIDQGQSHIVGYTDDESALLPENEYVLFGDHTRIVKYYYGQFAQGADGLKILVSNRNIILPHYLFHVIKSTDIPSRGYSRHWSIVKELQIPIPTFSKQKQIVAILNQFETSIANLEQQLTLREKQYEYYRNKLLTF